MELYDLTTFECSRLITKRYSTSFSLGIRTLHKDLHFPIYAIYGFVRYADEIVDTFHQHDKRRLLERFRQDTWLAIEEKVSLNPVLHCFQIVVNQYHIDRELIEAFLYSMEMDLEDRKYDQAQYQQYIYGSAEVVGLMCLKVFCHGDQAEYERLLPPARALGSAFQKVNFLRDMQSDFVERGRVYFPGVNFTRFDQQAKQQIEQDIQQDFDHALQGIRQLPKQARAGVYLAYAYYLKLFNKIRKTPLSVVQTKRIRVPDPVKMLILLGTFLKMRLNYI